MTRLLLACACAALCLVAPASAEPPPEGMFPDAWYFYGGRHPNVARLRTLEGKPAPALEPRNWIGEPLDAEAMREKIIVVDFWATWCGPCMRAIPKNIELQDKYRDRGVVFVGVHDAARGSERMAQAARRLGINYPIAVDDGGVSTKAWAVSFWPMYAVVDRTGIVRAAGLQPGHIEDAIERLLDPDAMAAAAPDPVALAAAGADVPPNWLEGSAAQRTRLRKLMTVGVPPSFESEQWLNASPMTLEGLEGKVVMLDFWATWCGPCIRSIPFTNTLHDRYESQGLVVVGVCHPRGGENMSRVVEERGIRYPVCLDKEGSIISSFLVNGFPDYYFIGRDGTLRVADARNDKVEEVIRLLLNEKQ